MKKFNEIIGKIYGVMMSVSFFGGIVPLIPFIIALIIGGPTGEAISVFLYKQFYPWIIGIGSVAVLIGLIHSYIDKALSKKEQKTESQQ